MYVYGVVRAGVVHYLAHSTSQADNGECNGYDVVCAGVAYCSVTRLCCYQA